MLTAQRWVQTVPMATITHTVGSNYTTLEVRGNGGRKMFCESQISDNFWMNVAKVMGCDGQQSEPPAEIQRCVVGRIRCLTHLGGKKI